MPKIGLSMIVKNEEKLILRCLDSVRPLVDLFCISDTGSTDNTVSIIREYMAKYDIPGLVREDRWQDFSTNRNLALEGLRSCAVDYAFMIDADDTLEIAPGFNPAEFKARMAYDVYDVRVQHFGTIHPRPQIFRNKPGYRWVGVLHEYLEVPPGFSRATELGLTIQARIEGSRNADPHKFRKDAEILEKEIKIEKNPYLRARYIFYLAQSYRDCGEWEKAKKFYDICSKLGFWDQQVYISLLEAIRCCSNLNAESLFDAALDYYKRSLTAGPVRSEAHHTMALLCRKLGKNQQGMEIARAGLEIKQPDGLFIQPWIYEYGLKDEFAVNAYWAGSYLDCLTACLQLIASEKLPPGDIKRVSTNGLAALKELMPRFTSNTSLVFSD